MHQTHCHCSNPLQSLSVPPLLAPPSQAKEEAPTEKNTIVLRLKVECQRLGPSQLENEKVYSSMLQWLPGGSEYPEETATRFTGSQTSIVPDVRPVHDDILIAKLRPGQVIELECHCIKGVGEEHAKWSPVATAWYRLMPEVVLLEQPRGRLATELAAELPGLIKLVGSGEAAGVQVAATPLQYDQLLEKVGCLLLLACWCCQPVLLPGNCLDGRQPPTARPLPCVGHGGALGCGPTSACPFPALPGPQVRRLSGEEKWRHILQLRKKKDHFLWTIESTGAWQPHKLFNYAVRLMVSKADKVLEGLQKFPQRSWEWDAQ